MPSKIRKQLAAGTILTLVALAIISPTGCSKGPEVFSFDPREGVLDYIESHPVARDLFATDYLFRELPYTKPWDTEAVFVDRVDSSYRNVRVVDTTGVHFESPIGETDMAEATISDYFLISTERITADTTEVVQTNWRVVLRYGLFLRLGSSSQPYLGWVLRGFSGGFPRAGLTHAESSSGVTFWADGLNQERLRYLVIFGYNVTDTLGINHWIVDTVARQTEHYYLVLDEIPEIPQGDTVAFTTSGMDGDSPTGTGTVYQLLTAETKGGPVVRRMSAPDRHTYIDTIVTPTNNRREWNVVLFQEFRRPDRYGAIWTVPYRTGR
ncbi:MAG: hypothetical protein ABIE70_05525 [bacterium]